MSTQNDGALPPLMQSDMLTSGILATSGLSEFVGPVLFKGPVTINSTTPVSIIDSVEITGTLTATKLSDGTFKTIGGVVTSATILGTSNTVSADSLKTTGAVVNVAASAPPATNYVLIATSATAATWQAQSALTGVTATSLGYGMFYGLTTGTGNGGANDYAATVAVKTTAGTGRVPFPRLGSASSSNPPTILGDNSSVTLPGIGTYMVTFNVHTTETGQLQLELQGTALDYACAANFNPTSGGHPIGGTFFVTTTVVNSVLAVINPVGNATALTITPSDGNKTHANTQSLIVTRIA